MPSDPAPRERAATLANERRPVPDAREGAIADGRDEPDPRFWGPEPRVVRRARRREPTDEPPVAPWWNALVERVRDARVEVGIGVALVAVVAIVAGIVWYRMGMASGGGSERPPRADVPARDAPVASAPGAVPAGAGDPAPSRSGESVVVHVAGAVVRPGVLVMPAGARVIDAVEGAGGARPEADLDRLNLAAVLADGQRVLVAAVGAPVVAEPGGGGGVPGAPTGGLIDLNTATSAQLEELPGIGPSLAGAILAERERRGGFRSVNELREVRGIGEVRFAELRDRVTV